MNDFIKNVKDTQTPYGTAMLWWLGQMGLLVKMGDTVLCIDYFASDNPDRLLPPPIPLKEVSDIDIFLGTHDHLDHIDRKAWQIWAKSCPDAVFVFPKLHGPSLEMDGIKGERACGTNQDKVLQIGEITISCIAAAHEFLDQDPATGLYPCLQYVIEGNGVRIYHAGDTVRYEGMLPKLQAFGTIDAALLPINGRDAQRYRRNCIGNMTFQEAADLAGELCPGMVLPGHWDMFRGNCADPEAFRDYLEIKYGGRIPCRIPEYLAPVCVKRNDKRNDRTK